MPINYGSNDVSTSGNFRVDGTSTFVTNAYAVAIDVSGVAKFGTGGNGYIYCGDDTIGGELGFYTNNEEALALKMSDGSFHYGGGNYSGGNLVVTNSGNVGIGTQSPVAKLHVDGDIVQTNDYFDTVNDRKSTTYLLSTTTTFSVPSSELSSNGNKAIKLDTDRTYTFSILVTSRECSPAGLIGGFKLEGIVTDQNGLSIIVGTPVKTVFAKDNVAWDINTSITSVGADNYLTFTVDGGTYHTTRWVANLLVVEVGTNGTGY
jgi:hypothetical protein